MRTKYSKTVFYIRNNSDCSACSPPYFLKELSRFCFLPHCTCIHLWARVHTHTHSLSLSLKAAFIRTSYLWLELRNRWPLHSLWLLIHCLNQQELLNSARNAKWKFSSAIITTTQFTLEMSPMLQKWPLSIPYSHLPFAKSRFCLANTSS